MEVENPLPATAPQPGPEGPGPGPTDGLAAALAVEHGAAGTAASPATLPETFRRRGRPPVHGLYSRAAGSDGKHPVPPPGAEPLSPAEVESAGDTRISIPPDVLGKIVSQTLGAAESWAGWKITAMAKKAGLTPADISPQLERAQIPDESKQVVAELAPLALQEWGLDPQISPSAAIGVILVPWAFASVSAYFTLASLAAERLAMEKARGNGQGKAGENVEKPAGNGGGNA